MQLKPVSYRLQKLVTETGGRAPNGLPNFRVMRGHDRMTQIGGRWKDYDKNGNFLRECIEVREALKYPEAAERYIFEVLCPPENYGSERDWELAFTKWIDGRRIEELGPYPRSGEYELVKVIETPTTHRFVPLTEAICLALVDTARLNKELPARIKIEAARRRREKEEAAKEQRLIDRIEDMGLADFVRKPHIIHPGLKEEQPATETVQDKFKKTPGGLWIQ